MSELRNRMIQDMKLAGLVEGTGREYLRAVRQLTAQYDISPDRLATHMLQQGVDIRIIRILLGHSTLRSTEIYTHLTEPLREDLRQLLRRTTDGLFEGRGPKNG